MYVKENKMPFRYYNADARDNYMYESPGNAGNHPVMKAYDYYIRESILAYIELGGSTEALEKGGFITKNEDGQYTIDVQAIINDCKEKDPEQISSDPEVKSDIEKFKEKDYGISGFFFRNMEIDKEDGVSHKDIGKKVVEKLDGIDIESLSEVEKRDINSAKVLFAHMATGYIPRSTIVTASQMVADGAMMQIGCSQGKTTVLAFASYIAMQNGTKVMNTSSNPGLVMDNFDEFGKPYQLLGAYNEMCAITRDKDTDRDMIVTCERIAGKDDQHSIFFNMKCIDNPEDSNNPIIIIDGLPKEPKPLPDNPTEKDVEEYNKALQKYNKRFEEVNDAFPGFAEAEDKQKFIKEIVLSQVKVEPMSFKDRVKKTLHEKDLVMADTMTLSKYERELETLKGNDPSIKGICMCDEADCEFLDARPYEVIGSEYSKASQEERFNKRKIADTLVAQELAKLKDGKDLTLNEIRNISSANSIPLEFVKDAYYARTTMKREKEDYVINEDGSIKTLNPGKRILETDTQGHVQAIYAMRANERKGEPEEFVPTEKKVKDVIYPHDVIGKYALQSLISGTMEDRKLGEFRDTIIYEEYCQKRTELFKSLGFNTPATPEVVDFRTVGPLTREERGAVFSLTEDQPIQTTDGDKTKTDRQTCELKPHENFKCDDWRSIVIGNEGKLDKQWRKEVHEEITRRSQIKIIEDGKILRTEKGQPVLVSVPDVATGEFLGADVVYTDANKPDEKMYKDGKMYFESGEAYYMDDAYGRGYNSEFGGDNGHVLITRLPTNSRDLEQFLFRVARGGKEGSSSMVISPADPKLIEFLEEMDKQIAAGETKQYESAFKPEEWKAIQESGKSISTAYFENIINGKISIDRLVFDIYPKETMKIMEESSRKTDFLKQSKAQNNLYIEGARAANVMTEEQVELYKEALQKARVKALNEHEGEFPDSESGRLTVCTDIRKTAAISTALALGKNGVEITEDLFKSMMPSIKSEKTISGVSKDEFDKIFKAIQGKVNAYKQKDSETAIKENREETKTENPEERTTEPGDKTITLQEQALKGIGDYDLNADYIKNVAAGLYVDKTIGQQHESEANEI